MVNQLRFKQLDSLKKIPARKRAANQRKAVEQVGKYNSRTEGE